MSKGPSCDHPRRDEQDPLNATFAASGAGRAARVVGPAGVAAVGVFVVALVIYLRTLLPGPSFGDWAEMQFIPAQLGIPHPTGYPLYVLLGWLFSLVPIGSWAYRADLLSAGGGRGGRRRPPPFPGWSRGRTRNAGGGRCWPAGGARPPLGGALSCADSVRP